MNAKKVLAVATPIVVVALLASGYVSGKMTQRWGPTNALEQATARLESFPREIGSWSLVQPEPLSDDAIEKLQCTAYLHGEFVHAETGERVVVSLIVGPFGPMSVHTPDVCYPLSGYGALRVPSKLIISAPKTAGAAAADEFWTTAFQAKQLGSPPLHVYYAWYHGGRWMAPDWPRFDLGGDPALHKIQVASAYDADDKDAKSHPCYRFLQDFLPVWRDQLAKN